MADLRSSCYSTIRTYLYSDYWTFAAGYIGVYVFFAFFSTLILFKSGSVRPRRIMTWLATWSSGPKFFEGPLMEILAFGTGILAIAPLIALGVWIVATYTYEFSYNGPDTDLVGSYQRCKTLTATIGLMGASMEMLRWGLLTWYFRHWNVNPGTVKLLGIACVMFITYCFMLTQTVSTNDDILNAVVFLTFSALPLLRVLYFYYDDLAIDLNDYLYRTSGTHMMAKGAQWNAFEERWGFLRYFCHILTSLVLLGGYMLSAFWIDTRPSSPGYVMPYILLVDLAVLANLHNARCQNFVAEVMFSFFAIVGFRVIAVYLGWQDRSAHKPGAWELMEPVCFLLLMIVYCKALADVYWQPAASDEQTAVVEDRYTEWLDAQRVLVINKRNAADEDSWMNKFATCTRKTLLGIGMFCSMKKSADDKDSLQLVSDSILRDLRRLVRLSVLEVDYEKERLGKVVYVIRDYDGEERHSVVPNARGSFDRFKPVAVGRQALTAPDLLVTEELLLGIRSRASAAKRTVRWRAFVKFMHTYKLMVFAFLAHAVHALMFWYLRDPIDRDLPLFGQIRQTNFNFEVLMYATGVWIWTFVYGAFMTFRSTKEDMDAYRVHVRDMLMNEARDHVLVPRNLHVDKIRPRALSWQAGLVLSRAGNPKEVAKYLEAAESAPELQDACAQALWVVQQEGSGLLDFERVQLAGKVATLATLRLYSELLTAWATAAREHQGLGYEDFEQATQSWLLNPDGHPEHSVEEVHATWELCMVEASQEMAKTHLHTNDRDGLNAKKCSDLMMYKFCVWALQHTVQEAQHATRAFGASQLQEVEAAVSAAEHARSFFQSWSTSRELGTRQDLCAEAASKAAKRCGLLLTMEQKENAREGALHFSQLHAELQLQQIAEEEIRWPDWKGIASTKKVVYQFQERNNQARACTLLGMFAGACLSGFLGAVVYYDSESSPEWFANTHQANLRNLVWSIFFPAVMLNFFAVWRSWQRNNYFFFSSSGSLTELYLQFRRGVMQARDVTNVRLVIFGLASLTAWSITVSAVYSVDEGFTIAVVCVALCSTVPPIVKANMHRRALSFSHHQLVNGCIVVVILSASYWAIQDNYQMWIGAAAYYSLVVLFLAISRRKWVGWENNIYLANADKFWIFPMFVFLGAVYKHHTRDRPDEKTATVALLVGGCAVLALLALFYYAAIRLSEVKQQKGYQVQKEAQYLQELRTYFKLEVTEAAQEEEDTDHEDNMPGKDMGCLINCFQKMLKHWEVIAVVSVTIILLIASCTTMAFWVASQDTSFDSFQKTYIYMCAVLGTGFVLLFGFGMVGQTDDWSYTSVLLLPVIVPALHPQSSSYDFSKTVNLHNSAHMAIIASAIIALIWGLACTVFPDIDFIFGSNQLAIGVVTTSFTILFGLAYPLYKKLWLNYQISKNYKYLVKNPTIQSPAKLINRVCLEEFEKTDAVKQSEASPTTLAGLEAADIPLSFEQVCQLSDACLRKCYTKEIPGNSWPAPRAYLSMNMGGKGTTSPERMRAALLQMFPKAEADPSYKYSEFIKFFKRHVLQLSVMTWDDNFLAVKREDSIRELRSFRAKTTLADDISGLEGADYSATTLDRKVALVQFPQAMSTVALLGRCYDAHLPEGAHDRLPLFAQLYDNEQHSVRLHKEKMAFEGHFTLSVAVAAEVNAQVDQIAFYALQGGSTFSAADTGVADVVETMETELEPPLLDFRNQLAKTIYKTVNEGSEGSGVGKMFLPGRETWSDRVLQGSDYGVHLRKALRSGECILSSVGGGIHQMYGALKLIAQYLALPSAPESVVGDWKQSVGVHLIDEACWFEIFGHVGSDSISGEKSTLTVIDLFHKVEAMHKAYEQFSKDYDHYAAPLEYCAALVTEFFDEDLFVGWFQSGQVRYAKLVTTISESIGFRVFVENMMRTAKNDETVQGFAQERPQKAFTQLFQQVNTMMEGFRNASREIMPMTSTFISGRARPYYGAAALREAYLRVKAIATYEVVYEMLAGGEDEVSYVELKNWYERLKAREERRELDPNNDSEHESWVEPNRFEVFPELQPVSRERFIEMHVKLVLNSTTDSVGMLCVAGAKAHREFELLLADVVHDFVEEHAHAERVTLPQSAAAFRAALGMTSCAAELAWLRETLIEVENAFDDCFAFDNASYLWHFNRSKNAIQQETSDARFRYLFQKWNSESYFGHEAFRDPRSMISRILTFGQTEADKCGKCASCESGGMLHKCRAFKSKLLYENEEHLLGLLSLFECHAHENRSLEHLDVQSKMVTGLGVLEQGQLGGYKGELSKLEGSIKSLEREVSTLERQLGRAQEDAKPELQQKILTKQGQLPVLQASAHEAKLKFSAANSILEDMRQDWVQKPPHRHFRRSFAALYRVARVLDMTKTDADKNSTRDQELRRDKEEVSTQLEGLMGNCAEEEALLKSCKKIVYPKTSKSEGNEEDVEHGLVRRFFGHQIPEGGLLEGHDQEAIKQENLNLYLLDQMLLLTCRMGISLDELPDELADSATADASAAEDGDDVVLVDLEAPKTESPRSPEALIAASSFTTLVMRGALKLPLIAVDEIRSSGDVPTLRLTGHRIHPSMGSKEELHVTEYHIVAHNVRDHERIYTLLKPKSDVLAHLQVSKVVLAGGLGSVGPRPPSPRPRKSTLQVGELDEVQSVTTNDALVVARQAPA